MGWPTRSREPVVRRRNGQDKMAAAFACSADTDTTVRHQWRSYGGGGEDEAAKETLPLNLLRKKKINNFTIMINNITHSIIHNIIVDNKLLSRL